MTNDERQVKFLEDMIEFNETEAKSCSPSRFDKIQLWTYKILCCWFFLLGTADITLLHEKMAGCIQFIFGVFWIYLLYKIIGMQKSRQRQGQTLLRTADLYRAELAILDPSNAKVPLIIEEEP